MTQSSMNRDISLGNWFPFPASTPHSITYFLHVKLNVLLSILIFPSSQVLSRQGLVPKAVSTREPHGSFMDFASCSVSWLFFFLLPVIPWILLLCIVCSSGYPDVYRTHPLFHILPRKRVWGELCGKECEVLAGLYGCLSWSWRGKVVVGSRWLRIYLFSGFRYKGGWRIFWL